jgi:hypothetical protein
MTVYRTVRISDDQLPKFEKMMDENGFEIILNEAPEIPLEMQKEMERRWETRHERTQHSFEDVKDMLRTKGWSGS